MPIKRKVPLALELYKVAEGQLGYFTTRQAKLTEYSDSNFSYYIRRGYWKHCLDGVYRLQAFPPFHKEEFVLFALWSHGKAGSSQCIFSHLSALYYYDLLDTPPSVWHMTKSPQCRIAKKVPDNLILYKASLSPSDIIDAGNFRVTTVQRTMHDIIKTDLLSFNQLSNLIAQTVIKGLLELDFFEKGSEFSNYLEEVYNLIQSYIEKEMVKIMAFRTGIKI